MERGVDKDRFKEVYSYLDAVLEREIFKRSTVKTAFLEDEDKKNIEKILEKEINDQICIEYKGMLFIFISGARIWENLNLYLKKIDAFDGNFYVPVLKQEQQEKMTEKIYQLKLVRTETAFELTKYWHFLHSGGAQLKIEDIEAELRAEGFKTVLTSELKWKGTNSDCEMYNAEFLKGLNERIQLTCTEYPLHTYQ